MMADIIVGRSDSLPMSVKWRLRDSGDGVHVRETYVDNIVTITFADNLLDPFARLRTTQPTTLFDSKAIWDDPDFANNVENFPLFWDNQEISGSGTGTMFNADRASTTLSVSNGVAGTRVRQSKQRMNYQAAKGQLVILSGIAGSTLSGNTKRLGYFDDGNGLFYQDEGGIWSVVRRTSSSGSPVDTVVTQPNWNLDKMDGTGASGVTIDQTKCQILFLDFEWLGVGRVRFGFFIGGVPIYVHEILNTNNLDVVYMSTPNLPIRMEISNDGTGGTDSVEQICSTVVAEGGVQPLGIFRSGNMGALGASEIQASVIDTSYAVCGLRLKSTHLSANIQEINISIAETAGGMDTFLWSLHFNPTLTTGLTYADQSQSAVQFGVGLPAGDIITNAGHLISSGYVSGRLELASIPMGNALRLGSLIDGTPDEYVVGVTPVTAGQDILGSLSWRESW